MATDQQRRTLDALERRFALAKTEIEQQQEKTKKRPRGQYQNQHLGQTKENASDVDPFRTPISKKAHVFFDGHAPSREPSGKSGSSKYKGKKDVDANDCTYTQISEPIHENLINTGLQLPNNQMVDNVLHELFQNGEDAVRYASGFHNKKINCWFKLDVSAQECSASSAADIKAKKSHAKRCKRHMSMKQHKKCGSFDLPQEFHKFDIFQPMHEMWKDYILKLIKNIRDIQAIAQRLLFADLHGAILQVVECKVTSFFGVSGIMVRETANTFGIITRNDNFRVVPKKGSVFILRADCWKITLRGDELISRKFGSLASDNLGLKLFDVLSALQLTQYLTNLKTYERSCIQRWIHCGNKTCPKTGQMLPNFSLTPNYVLRSLISQWCEEHKVELPVGSVNGRLRKSDGSFQEVSGDIATIKALVHKLSSRSVEESRNAATEIRSLSKRSTDNKILIAEAGAVPILVNLLTSEDLMTQENVVTSILNLSIYEHNKSLIMLAGAVPSIVQVLRMGSMEARENAAASLFSLSLLDENKITIRASGAISALVELLQSGSLRGKKDAATALFNLCIYQGNKGRAIRAGILVPLMKMLTDSGSSMVDEALTILSVLASHQEGKTAIAKASTIPVLIDLLRTGLPRNKENGSAILLALCKKDTENLACIGRLGAFIPLTELAKSGTERAKRKATSLLELLRKLQQL